MSRQGFEAMLKTLEAYTYIVFVRFVLEDIQHSKSKNLGIYLFIFIFILFMDIFNY